MPRPTKTIYLQPLLSQHCAVVGIVAMCLAVSSPRLTAQSIEIQHAGDQSVGSVQQNRFATGNVSSAVPASQNSKRPTVRSIREATPVQPKIQYGARVPASRVLTSRVEEPIVPFQLRSSGPRPVKFRLDGKWDTGLHLIDSRSESLVIARTGWLHTVKANRRESDLRETTEAFAPATVTQMRNGLRQEFGSRFEVIATSHFLVVQPKGRGSRWPEMFERCHRSFVDFMTKHRVKVRRGRFPMVAVVFPDARAMYAELERLKIDVSRVAGIYANRCNRVMTHDGGRLSEIAATVRHEAAHQSAFNSGVHSRVNDTPSWITEGIGQMFEPAALANGVAATRLGDRMNRESINYLRENVELSNSGEIQRWVEQLIHHDEPFRDPSTVHMAYSMAWAMMFYLSERDTEAFADVLNFTATRPPFENYHRGQRQIDFERITETDTVAFSNRLSRFLAKLP